MAIMDRLLLLADAKSLVGAKSATITDSTVDLGVANPNVGRGEPVYVHARVGTAVTSASPSISTLALVLQHGHSSAAGSMTNLMNLNLAGAASMTVNLLTANKLVYSGALPPTCRRYIRLKATVGVTPTTAGTLDAWLDIGSLPTDME
jgi:hypothetical protein